MASWDEDLTMDNPLINRLAAEGWMFSAHAQCNCSGASLLVPGQEEGRFRQWTCEPSNFKPPFGNAAAGSLGRGLNTESSGNAATRRAGFVTEPLESKKIGASAKKMTASARQFGSMIVPLSLFAAKLSARTSCPGPAQHGCINDR